MTAIDLTQFDAAKLEEVREFKLKLPNGETHDQLVVGVRSRNSKEGLKDSYKKIDKRRREAAQMAREGKVYVEPLEDEVQEALETCVSVTVYIKNGDVRYETEGDKRKFFESYVWSRAQVIEHASDEDFFYGIEKKS